MGRQYRSPRRGASAVYGVQPLVSSTSTLITIPNYGVTDMSTWTAGEYVLDAPDTYVRKTLIRSSTVTNGGVVVRFSTGTSVTGFNYATTANTQITFNATVDACVELIGLNSTHWAVVSAYPPQISNTTGIVLAGS